MQLIHYTMLLFFLASCTPTITLFPLMISNCLFSLFPFSLSIASLSLHWHLVFAGSLAQNWDPDVREDMEMFLSRLVPEVINAM